MYTHGNTVVRILQLWKPEVMYNMIQFAKTTHDGKQDKGKSRLEWLRGSGSPQKRHGSERGDHGRASGSHEGPGHRRKVWCEPSGCRAPAACGSQQSFGIGVFRDNVFGIQAPAP